MAPWNAILEFWFGTLGATGLPATDKNKLWFGHSEDTDRYIHEKFGPVVANARQGALDNWLDHDEGLVALVLLLDQFTRNIHRGSPAAFAGDTAALAAAELAIDRNRHLSMPVIHRVFLYIPFEHSEQLEVQDQGVALFDQLLADIEAIGHPDVLEVVQGYRQYSIAHRDVIKKFGRFPHRNDILGRDSTEAELAHLASHGGF